MGKRDSGLTQDEAPRKGSHRKAWSGCWGYGTETKPKVRLLSPFSCSRRLPGSLSRNLDGFLPCALVISKAYFTNLLFVCLVMNLSDEP